IPGNTPEELSSDLLAAHSIAQEPVTPGYQQKALTRNAFLIGDRLSAIGPTVAKKFFVRAKWGVREMPHVMVTWAMGDASAHSCSFFIEQRTRQRGLPSNIYVGKASFFSGMH